MFTTDVVHHHLGVRVRVRVREMMHLLIRIENFDSKILNNGIFPSGYVLKS